MQVRSLAWSLALGLGVMPFLAGCGGRVASAPAPGTAMPPVDIPFTSDDVSPDITATVGVRLTGEKPFQSAHYGQVLGYFKGRTAKTSQVVTVSPNINVAFVNVDSSLPHTASFLGKATSTHAPWPGAFNGSSKASPAGTAIGTKGFSTGTINPGSHSALYSSGAPGFYMFGCAFHYDSSGMRTVVIVK